MAEPRIAVLVSLGRHPSAAPSAGPRRRAAPGAWAARPSPCCAGDPDEPALRGYLALGAPCVQTIDVPRDRDVLDPLAALLSDYALVLCGSRGESGMAAACCPSAGAASGRPLCPTCSPPSWPAARSGRGSFCLGPAPRHGSGPASAADRAPAAPFEPRYAYARERAGAYCPLRRPPRPRRWPTPGASNPTRGRASRARTPLRPRPAAGRDRHGQPGRRSHSARLPGRQSARGACLSAHSQPG